MSVITALLAILGIALSVSASHGQQQQKLFRVGHLSPNSPTIAGKYIDAFRDELRRLGYDEKGNLLIEARFAEGRPEKLNELANELAKLNVDVFLAPTEPALNAAKQSGLGIPIVTVSCDPLEKMLGSLARPGGNATGFSCVNSDLAGKRLSLLKELLPNLWRVAMLYNAADAFEPDLKNVERSGSELGLTVSRFPVSSPADFGAAFASMEKQDQQALYISTSGFANFHRRTLAQHSQQHRLPAIFGFREFAEDGGLIAYGASLSDGYRRAAHFIDKIFKGASPKELPAEEPTRFELVLNAKTAKALGITIPPSLLARADEVVE
jgi:putative ABC transport system substrate-binding protein